MKEALPPISVIVPAHNEEDYISNCLVSLLKQDLDPSQREIIVVDNTSSDNTAKIAEKFGVKVVREEKKGYVNALIKGVNESRGKILVFTDADSKTPSQWLTRIKEKFDEDPQLEAYGGILSFPEASPLYRKISEFWQGNPSDLMGANMAIRRESLGRIGGFDPRINLGADVYLSLKLKSLGGKIQIDKSNVVETSTRRFSGDYLKDLLQFFKQNLNYLSIKLKGKSLFFSFEDIR